MSQHGRIKMKRMDSDLKWMNGNKSRSSIMESLSSLAVPPLQSLIHDPPCINYSQWSPLSLTKCSNSPRELTRLRDFLMAPVCHEAGGYVLCHPIVTQGLMWIALLRKALLTSPNFATFTLCKQLCCFRRGEPGAGSQQMQVASCSQ